MEKYTIEKMLNDFQIQRLRALLRNEETHEIDEQIALLNRDLELIEQAQRNETILKEQTYQEKMRKKEGLIVKNRKGQVSKDVFGAFKKLVLLEKNFSFGTTDDKGYFEVAAVKDMDDTYVLVYKYFNHNKRNVSFRFVIRNDSTFTDFTKSIQLLEIENKPSGSHGINQDYDATRILKDVFHPFKSHLLQ